ncbi:uncharacterized protein [Embiotoca jacksoni]|uniref:uncharacterized protein n=1 Tax=Embiotoca jacksoni TaxID=100190 RepID=UPI0037045FB9
MVQLQLCTLEHLLVSGFGRPSPRHGLQLLFWFAKHCVTCELADSVVIIKLVSDCQPDAGFYGFHLFGNIEELLPVLNRRRKNKRKLVYFEVGNLNTETYPASANLPAYVRENYGLRGNVSKKNIDRLIISYEARGRLVETVYVTEHDGAAFGMFRPDGTHQISRELIQTLQNPQLDLATFLTLMGYDGYMEMYYPDQWALQVVNTEQTYSGSPATTEQSAELGFNQQLDVNYQQLDVNYQQLDVNNQHLGVNYQQLDVNYQPFSYDTMNMTPYNNSGHVVNYSAVQHTYMQRTWQPSWEHPYTASDEKPKKRSGGGGRSSFFKILLGAGALYLLAKCFSWWLKSCWNADVKENIIKTSQIPPRTLCY